MNFLKKIILILLFLFPISNSFGATLTHVQTVIFDDESSAKSQIRGVAGIEFNKDGTKLFMSSTQPQLPAGDTILVSEFNLSTPYDISSRTYAGDSERCAMSEIPVAGVRAVYDLEFSHDGTKLFVASRTRNNSADSDNLFRYDLTTPYDISTCQFAQEVDLDTIANLNDSAAGDFSRVDEDYVGHEHVRLQGFEFNNTGTKLFLSWFDNDGSAKLLEYTLSTPYDTTSIQLVTTAGIDMGTGTTANVINSAGIRFSANGKRIFIISHSNGSEGISQISLTNAFDTSSFVMDGKFNLETASPSNQQPRGVAFNSNGLKLYIGNDFGHNGFDQIMEYDLVCPFTIFSGTCPSITENSDRTGMAEAQIELAKRTINFSTNSALNRLKWIRRNKDKQNLSNQNIKLNFSNSLLSSLKAVPISSFKKISNTKNKKDSNKKYFYWSEGSINLGRVGDTNISSTKKVNTNALTFGLDRFTDDYSLEGFAFRFGSDDVDIGSDGSNLDSNTYNITYYSTSPIKDDTKYLDKIFGIGKIRSDILYAADGKNLTADRTGNQIYGTFKIKDEHKRNKLTLIPSLQFDFGHTILNGYTETGTGAIEVEDQHVRTKNLRATMAVVEDLSIDKYTLKRHGKLEYLAELDRSSNFKYTYVGDGSVKFNETLHTGALHNLNGEIGIDIIFPEHYSVFIIYERNHAFSTGYTDNLYIALGYLPHEDTEYAFSLNGSDNLMSKFEIKKSINGYDLTFNINDDLTNLGDNKETSINLNKVF